MNHPPQIEHPSEVKAMSGLTRHIAERIEHYVHNSADFDGAELIHRDQEIIRWLVIGEVEYEPMEVLLNDLFDALWDANIERIREAELENQIEIWKEREDLRISQKLFVLTESAGINKS